MLCGALCWLTACANDETRQPEPAEPTSCEPADRPLVCGRKLNIAHRGGARLAPENTLVAFANADNLGVDALELDVHATSDGVIVVMHDDEVDRTTDGSGAVKDMTFDTVRQLDAGYHFSSDGGQTYPYRGEGVVVPSLEEVLEAFPEQRFAIEIKQLQPRIQDAVVQLLDDTGSTDRAQIASFFDDVLIELRAARPDVITSMGTAEIVQFQTLQPEQEDAYQAPARVIQAPMSLVDADFVAKAIRTGVAVHAWTVNDPADMEVLLGINVHGVITDDPAALAEILAAAATQGM
jgi:glycerophosphoryl diester phosphodiesterase